MNTRAYSRCNSGHYFVGENCPYDGWSSTASKELTLGIGLLLKSGRPVSMEELRRAGVSETTILRTIIIQFGSDTSAFDAISPSSYSVNEKRVLPQDDADNFQ
jgi:hypothetical protein